MVTKDFTKTLRRPNWGSIAARKHVHDFHEKSDDMEMLTWDAPVTETMEKGSRTFGDLGALLREART